MVLFFGLVFPITFPPSGKVITLRDTGRGESGDMHLWSRALEAHASMYFIQTFKKRVFQ